MTYLRERRYLRYDQGYCFPGRTVRFLASGFWLLASKF
jgi:hypothetical protein